MMGNLGQELLRHAAKRILTAHPRHSIQFLSLKKKADFYQVWSLTPVFLACRRLRQEDCKLESRLGCQVRESHEEEKSIESSLPGFSNANGK